jgi:hypothetical protein
MRDGNLAQGTLKGEKTLEKKFQPHAEHTASLL